MAAMTQKLTFKVYAIALGAVATVVSKKLLQTGWRAATGRPAPDPNDPETSATEAAMWAVASGVGVGAVQVLLNRFLGERFAATTGEEPPANLQARVKL